MIKVAQGTGVGTLIGLFIWGALMEVSRYFNIKWVFWALILILAAAVVWAMIWWPWPRVNRREKV